MIKFLLFKKRKIIRLKLNKYLNKSINHFEKMDTYSIYHIANDSLGYPSSLRKNYLLYDIGKILHKHNFTVTEKIDCYAYDSIDENMCVIQIKDYFKQTLRQNIFAHREKLDTIY